MHEWFRIPNLVLIKKKLSLGISLQFFFKLIRWRHKLDYAIFFSDIISNKMVPNLNVFGMTMKYHIHSEIYGTGIVALYLDS